jgi:hypothetical protein
MGGWRKRFGAATGVATPRKRRRQNGSRPETRSWEGGKGTSVDLFKETRSWEGGKGTSVDLFKETRSWEGGKRSSVRAS